MREFRNELSIENGTEGLHIETKLELHGAVSAGLVANEVHSLRSIEIIGGLFQEVQRVFYWEEKEEQEGYLLWGYSARRSYILTGPKGGQVDRNTARLIGLTNSLNSELTGLDRSVKPALWLDTAERRQAIRTIRKLLSEGTYTTLSGKGGYQWHHVLYGMAPAFGAALLSGILFMRQQAFEQASLTEHLVCGNDSDMNDCAGVAYERQKAWWRPEKWATLVITAKTYHQHVTMVVGGKILVALKPDVPLHRLKATTDLATYKSAKALWASHEQSVFLRQTSMQRRHASVSSKVAVTNAIQQNRSGRRALAENVMTAAKQDTAKQTVGQNKRGTREMRQYIKWRTGALPNSPKPGLLHVRKVVDGIEHLGR